MEYTYSYLSQASGVYGSDTYGTSTYSCVESDVSCTTVIVPNTGFFTAQNVPLVVGSFLAIVLVATIITYAILRKSKKQRS